MINKSTVIAILANEFGVGNLESANREEKKLANALKSLMNQSEAWDDFEVEEEEDELNVEACADIEVDADYEDEFFANWTLEEPGSPENCIRFGDNFVSVDQVRSALNYFRQPAKGSRSLDSMTSRFRWITDRNHVQKLRYFELEGGIFLY
jgi:hypothetical protein